MRTLRVYVLACLSCLRAWRAYVLMFLRAWCACVCTCVLVMMKCFIFLRVCILGVLFCLFCFTFQYLNLKIFTVKKIVRFVKLNIFLFIFWYHLIYLFVTLIHFCPQKKNLSFHYFFLKSTMYLSKPLPL